MARRPSRSLAALLTALVTTACTTPSVRQPPTTVSAFEITTTSTVDTTTTTSTTTTSTTTTTVPITTSSTSPATSTTVEPPQIDAEVVVPEGPGPFPAVVLVHGGSWVAGVPGIMEPLADHLNENGFLTVNTSYALATLEQPGFPAAIEDVACAVRYAASHPDSDGTVALVGHSAGAHIGAVVAMTGDRYEGECPFSGTGVPERFIGLAGPYDVSRLGLALAPFFGGLPEELSEEWEAGNPQLLTDENTTLESLIIYGELDGFVPDDFAVDFHNALITSGSESSLELIEGARHNDTHDPDLVGDLIVTWLERERVTSS